MRKVAGAQRQEPARVGGVRSEVWALPRGLGDPGHVSSSWASGLPSGNEQAGLELANCKWARELLQQDRSHLGSRSL